MRQMGLGGDQHRVGRCKPVQRQQPQAGRAVQQHIIKIRPHLFEPSLQDVFAAHACVEAVLGVGQCDIGWRKENVVSGHDFFQDIPQSDTTGDCVAHHLRQICVRCVLYAAGHRQAGLRIEIDQQNTVAALGQSGSQR